MNLQTRLFGFGCLLKIPAIGIYSRMAGDRLISWPRLIRALLQTGNQSNFFRSANRFYRYAVGSITLLHATIKQRRKCRNNDSSHRRLALVFFVTIVVTTKIPTMQVAAFAFKHLWIECHCYSRKKRWFE